MCLSHQETFMAMVLMSYRTALLNFRKAQTFEHVENAVLLSQILKHGMFLSFVRAARIETSYKAARRGQMN